MTKESKILDNNWPDFCKALMDIKNINQVRKMLRMEQTGQNRTTFINRMKARIRQLAAEDAV